MTVPAPRAPAERIALIIDWLCRALGGPVARPGQPGLPAAIPGVLLTLIWNRLRRLARRLARVAEKIEAGIPPATSRQRSPRPQRPPPDPLPLRLPCDRGWLVRLVGYNAAGGASQLRHLLAQPEMAPLLADPRMARLLRPLCHLLGVTPPPEIARPATPAPPQSPEAARSSPQPPPAAAPVTATPPPRPPGSEPVPRVPPAACGPPPLPA